MTDEAKAPVDMEAERVEFEAAYLVVFNASTGTTNQAPVANPDGGFNTGVNTPITIAASKLLANDTDPNGDPLVVTGVSGASQGTATYNQTSKAVTFTPNSRS